MEYIIEKKYTEAKQRKLSKFTVIILSILVASLVSFIIFTGPCKNFIGSICSIVVMAFLYFILLFTDKSKVVDGYKNNDDDIPSDDVEAKLKDLKKLYEIIDGIGISGNTTDKINTLIERYRRKIADKKEFNQKILMAAVTPIYTTGITSIIGLLFSITTGELGKEYMTLTLILFILLFTLCIVIIVGFKAISMRTYNWEYMINELENVKVFIIGKETN